MQSPANPQSRPQPAPRHGRAPLLLATLVFIVSALVSLSAWNGARRGAIEELHTIFDYRARDMAYNVQRRMAVYEQVLRGEQGFLRGSVEVSREEFAEYYRVLRLDEHFPGMQGIGIAAIIPPGGIAAHEQAVRREGFPGYTVHPPGPRDVVTSITHLEPFSGSNLRAFGYDMYSEPVRRAAMATARDTGRAAVTGKVTLVQEGEGNGQPGILMYLPVYRARMPITSVDERRAAIAGWAYAPFRMNDLMRGLGGGHADDLGTHIYDGAPAAGALLYQSPGAVAGHEPMFTTSASIQMAGRPWTLVFGSAPAFEATLDSRRPLVIGLTGLGLGFLLSLIVWLLASERRRAVELAHEMTLELRQSHDRVAAEQRRMKVILQNAYDAFIAVDAQGRITDWNVRASQLFGWSEHEALGRDAGELLLPPEQRARYRDEFARFAAGCPCPLLGGPHELALQHRNGSLVAVEVAVAALPTERGFGASAFVRDIGPRKAAEAREQLRQQRLDEARAALQRSQKLEAVGKLTGGVAHDFNNLLHIISANVQLMLRSEEANRKRLQSILDAVERGSKLSAQLLAFARRQPLHPSEVNLAQLLERMDSLLHRAGGEAVQIRKSGPGDLWHALVDPNQLENVILNLVINARDAMDGRGRVTIELANTTLEQGALPDPDFVPGQYVTIAVSDTGSGMPQDVMERAFEPFFTTKPEGKGTGLGLSMAHGFVKQSGGHIRLSSVVGEGTTVSIYLPRCASEIAGGVPPRVAAS